MNEFTPASDKAKNLIEDSHNLIYEVEVNPQKGIEELTKKWGFGKFGIWYPKLRPKSPKWGGVIGFGRDRSGNFFADQKKFLVRFPPLPGRRPQPQRAI